MEAWTESHPRAGVDCPGTWPAFRDQPKGCHRPYSFRHNRRRTPLAAFHTLLGLAGTHQPTTYRQITTHGQRAA